jgi:hypothetical protein
MLRLPRRFEVGSLFAIGFRYGDPPREQLRASDRNESRKLERTCLDIDHGQVFSDILA